MVGMANAATHAYRENGIPLLRNQNIKAGYLDESDVLYIDPTFEKVYKNKRLKAGDLLTARTGYPGMTCIVPPQHELSQSFTTLITRPDPSQISSSYLCHFVNSEAGQRFFDRSQIGGAQKNVNAGSLRSMPIVVPPREEQRAIAEALSDVDGLLGALDTLIAKKRAIKQAAMQQLLTCKTRLPTFSGEWSSKPLGNLCALKSGLAIPSERIDDHSEYPCYGGNGLRGFTTSFTHEGEYALIGRQGALCGNIIGVSGKFYASEHALVVTPKPRVSIHWLTCILDRMKLNQYSESSAQSGLSAEKLLLLEVYGPTEKDEQAAIATVLSDMDAEITALEARRDKTRAIKQGMMQQLLTGRVRLVKPAQKNEAA